MRQPYGRCGSDAPNIYSLRKGCSHPILDFTILDVRRLAEFLNYGRFNRNKIVCVES